MIPQALPDLWTVLRTGLLQPQDPRVTLGVVRAVRKWDLTFAGLTAIGAARSPDRVAIVDDEGPTTYAELARTSNQLANALRAEGVRPGQGVGLLCRDSRFFVQAVAAVSKLGADLLLLNTSFSATQAADVLEREGAVALVCDPEFAGYGATLPRITALPDADDREPPAPPAPGRQVILTSGTTGTPKGARRPPSTPREAIIGFLAAVPFRTGRTHVVAAPLFHSWGFAHMGLALMLGGTVVVRRRFDPAETVRLVAEHRADVLALVPVMAQRIMALPERPACPSLRIAAFGGSAIPGLLATAFMDAFGEVVYNTYGSTEVAVVTVAGPADLRADPHTAGRPIRHVALQLLDADGRPVPDGAPGRIFASNAAAFEGYTGGGTKAMVGDLMSTGDVGSLDADGRLRVEGRDDDMIVSGGENVFPAEVEDVIAGLDGVVEVAVVGADDPEFGQRLVAHVVGDVTEAAVKDAVRDRLARYKVPRDVHFVDALPRTATGKVLKRELRA